MPKVKEILSEMENLEISRLRLKILQSKSIKKSAHYYKEIETIVEKAKERYYSA